MALDGFCNLKWHGLLWLYVGLVLLGISLFFVLVTGCIYTPNP
jgi:hypothetical protein